ncbi:MAG: hypothetical protein U1F70_10535 [Candidatus Competibacteraceae bacterium]
MSPASREVNGWLEGQPELKRTFALWIRAMVLRHSRNHLVLPKVRDLKELKMTLTDRFDAWAREYEQKCLEKGLKQSLEKGLERGLAQGEALLLQRQLARRFGPSSRQTRRAGPAAPNRAILAHHLTIREPLIMI